MTQTIHLIFKTHLDIGFTGTAADVTRRYFDAYIPQAVATAAELRARGGDRFIWTTGSWLIYEYLEQADPAGRAALEAAIQAGDITWHALPFTAHSELLDPGLYRFGLDYSRRLDRRFDRQTLAAKQTDVPGHTRGIVPLLAEAGVRFLHIGVNDASAVPAVPPLFRWRSPDGAEIVVMYAQGYGGETDVDGLDQALAFAHTLDNLGPQTPAQAAEAYAEIRARHPGADVRASTLDDFARALLPLAETLPLVTDEIGDTWIHGAGSDPVKLARYRALLRLRAGWNDLPADLAESADRFSRRLILIPEHTWGLDEKTFLGDYENYAGPKFRAARAEPKFQAFEASWAEQRGYIDQAVAELEGTPLAEPAAAALAETVPARLDLKAWKRVIDTGNIFETGHFSFRFDAISGAVSMLRESETGRDWAGQNNKLGLFRYQIFSQADYDRFFDQYIAQTPATLQWAPDDFAKPGIEQADAERRWFMPQLVEIYRQEREDGRAFMALLSFPSRARVSYGCPKRIALEWFFPRAAREARLTVSWFDKPACRLPEASWLSFMPVLAAGSSWSMDKLGQDVSPAEVVARGARHMHAVGHGVTARDGARSLAIETLDAALVAPGAPALLDFTGEQPDPHKGMHFNLHNNVWGTNFPMWFEDNARFRFILRAA